MFGICKRCAPALLLFAASTQASAAFVSLGILGDSLSDTGNLYAATSSVSFGIAAVPPAPYYQGRFSNGPVWGDYYKSANPLINVGNFAYGGALSGTINGTDNVGDSDLAAVPLFGSALEAVAIGLDTELAFLPNVAGSLTAFALWIGANDINNATGLGFARPQDIVSVSLANVQNAVDTLLGLGAVEVYLANLPDLGRTPSALASGSGHASDLSAATVAFNNGLASIATGAGSGVRLVDMYSAFNQLLDNPLAFGFSDITTPCVDGLFDSSVCADPNQHLFWDPVHPTTGAHALVADVFSAAFNATVVPLPGPLLLLASALVSLGTAGAWRRREVRRGQADELAAQ